MEAHTAATECAIGPIALARAERFRVSSALPHSSLEPLAALDALGDDPAVRHPHGGMVVVDVTGDRHESKVLKAVVSLIAVDMVYLLPAPELAAKMLAHDEAMLKDVEPAARDLDVPVVSPSANRLATRVAAHPWPSGDPSRSHISAARA